MVPEIRSERERRDVYDGLTAKRRSWYNHYRETMNATEAARLAKYSGTTKSLTQKGSRNLKLPAIQALLNYDLRKADLSAEQCVERIRKLAMATFDDFLELDPKTPDGYTISLRRAQERGAFCTIKRIKKRTRERRIRLPDGRDAVEIETEIDLELRSPEKMLELLLKLLGQHPDEQKTSAWHQIFVQLNITPTTVVSNEPALLEGIAFGQKLLPSGER